MQAAERGDLVLEADVPPTAHPTRRRRRRIEVLTSAADVPVAVVDEILEEMARVLTGTPAARRCCGLSLLLIIDDHRAAPARFDVHPGGHVVLSRPGALEATFLVTGRAAVIDAVLRGRIGVLCALASRSVVVQGPLPQLHSLLRLFPAVQVAYRNTRDEIVRRHAAQYRFHF